MIEKPVNKQREQPRPQNTTKADVNEILFGYFLSPGPASDPFSIYSNKSEVVRAYNDKAEQLPYDLWYMELRRAEEMAKVFKDYAKKNGYGTKIAEVVWTARNGSLGQAVGYSVPQTGPGKNPSDVIVRFSDSKKPRGKNSTKSKGGAWLGASAKSTASGGEIAFANPGLGTISQDLFNNKQHLNKIIDKHKSAFIKKYSELRGLSNSAMKQRLKQNPALMEEARIAGTVALREVRDAIIDRIVKLDYEDWQKFLLDFIQADFQGPHYVKVTGQGNKEPFRAIIEDPAENKKTRGIRGPNLILEDIGDNSILVYSYEGKKLFRIRMKWESAPMVTSIKLSGDPA